MTKQEQWGQALEWLKKAKSLIIKIPTEVGVWEIITELEMENLDSPPYVTSHGQKIWDICVFLLTHLEAADRVCTPLQVQTAQLDATCPLFRLCNATPFPYTVQLGPEYPQILLHS